MDPSKPFPRIRVGICARDKKVSSKPMKNILQRLPENLFEIVIFGDDTIFNKPIEQWPRVDCLISFFSSGFPLEKAIAYCDKYKPFLVNDLKAEYSLRDRRSFYKILQDHDIPVPNHLICNRDGPQSSHSVLEEFEDYLVIDGQKISKPFVEKPVDSEDHNIAIYYPRRMGGGSKRLFRKVGNVSSKFYPDLNTVRRAGSYIYEEFLMTQGTDIKIYMVGPDYAHAEARKSPVVDGIVQRDPEGKEVRFPILLTKKEKDIARRVALAFRQNVCGFDLLRAGSVSYVCDVNGWSFVKKSHKYYDDCAELLSAMMVKAVAPERAIHLQAQQETIHMSLDAKAGMAGYSDVGNVGVESGSVEELRCVVGILRHGDRTPKQKLKLETSHSKFLNLFRKYSSNQMKEVKCKTATQLQEVLDITRELVEHIQPADSDSDDRGEEEIVKLIQVKSVLEKGGRFAGINRKVQLKPIGWRSLSSTNSVKSKFPNTSISSPDEADMTEGQAQGTAPAPSEPAQPEAQEQQAPASASEGLTVSIPMRRGERSRSFDTMSISSYSANAKFERTLRRPVADPGSGGYAHQVLTSAGVPAGRFVSQPVDPSISIGGEGGLFNVTDVEATGAGRGVLGHEDDEQKEYEADNAKPGNIQAKSAERMEEATKNSMEATRLLIVVKWGGVLTEAGRAQAEALGKHFRMNMYPGEGNTGLLRLHSTYRHDMKIYSADEGRVQMTAAAFVKGFLDLEGELTPILASLVTVRQRDANAFQGSDMLDGTAGAHELMDRAKVRLKAGLLDEPDTTGTFSPEPSPGPDSPSQSSTSEHSQPLDTTEEVGGDLSSLVDIVAPSRSASLCHSLEVIGADTKASLAKIHSLICWLVDSLAEQLREARAAAAAAASGATSQRDEKQGDDKRNVERQTSFRARKNKNTELLSDGETLLLMYERWKKLKKDFYNKRKKKFNLSKIPDIYDCIKYDVLHKNCSGSHIQELFRLAQAWADLVIPQEYGVTSSDKREIAARVAHHLLRKLYFDFTAVKIEEEEDDKAGTKEPKVPRDPGTTIPSYLSSATLGERSLSTPSLGVANPPPVEPPASHSEGQIPALRPLIGSSDSVSAEGFGWGLEGKNGAEDVPDTSSVPGDAERIVNVRESLGRSNSNTSLSSLSSAGGTTLMSAAVRERRRWGRRMSNGSGVGSEARPDDVGSTGDRSVMKDVEDGTTGENDGPTGNSPKRYSYTGAMTETVHQLDSRFTTDAGYGLIKSPTRHVRTRLYFTSESHVHSLMNVLREWGKEFGLLTTEAQKLIEQVPELDYLTFVVFRMYENTQLDVQDPRRHRIEILFSPGVSFLPFAGSSRAPAPPPPMRWNAAWSAGTPLATPTAASLVAHPPTSLTSKSSAFEKAPRSSADTASPASSDASSPITAESKEKEAAAAAAGRKKGGELTGWKAHFLPPGYPVRLFSELRLNNVEELLAAAIDAGATPSD